MWVKEAKDDKEETYRETVVRDDDDNDHIGPLDERNCQLVLLMI